MKKITKIISSTALVSLLAFGAYSVSIAADKKMATLDKAGVEKIVADYIANNPDKIIDALNAYQIQEQKRMEEEAKQALQTNRDYFVHNSALPSIGPANSDKVLVEFFDYNCGYCKRAFGDIARLTEDYKDLRIVFVEMPILSDSSGVASKMALAANKQGKYFEFHQALMQSTGALSIERLEQMAQMVGLDVAQLKKDMESADITKQIEENKMKAAEIGVRGTPGFIVGKELVRGAIGYDSMKEYVDSL